MKRVPIEQEEESKGINNEVCSISIHTFNTTTQLTTIITFRLMS